MNLILSILIFLTGFGIPKDVFQNTRNSIASDLFYVASDLTDPLCKAHEFYRHISLMDALPSEGDGLLRFFRKFFLYEQIVREGRLAAYTTLPGVVLRALAIELQTQPFLVVQHNHSSQRILPPDRTFSLLSWNICCVGGGYSVTDGGVESWPLRIDAILQKIVQADADINCLYETFDTKSAFYIADKLMEVGYSYVYFNIGPKAIGVSSGILVASKYPIVHPEFFPFSQDMLVGRTKQAAKGVFVFEIHDRDTLLAKVYATHLQHSEIPQFPTPQEVEARMAQMEFIIGLLQGNEGYPQILTGDLNLDDEEYGSSAWKSLFSHGTLSVNGAHKTWGGDQFCSQMMGKRTSKALNLDHTLVMHNGVAVEFETELLSADYEATHFRQEALSDHEGLVTHFVLNGS